MKFCSKRLFVLAAILLLTNFTSFAMYVNVSVYCDSWCGQPTGSMEAVAAGGVAPYTYAWDTGDQWPNLTNLNTGTYTVTVTDAMGATATGSGTISDVAQFPFYIISTVLANEGMNNGSIDVGLYTGMFAIYLPPETFNILLWDSSYNTILETHTFTCATNTCGVLYDTFDSLPPGHYNVECNSTGLGGCYTYASFNIKIIPNVYPSLLQTSSCNGSPTGRISGNLHPSAQLNGALFNCNILSNLGFTNDVTTSKYKINVYDAFSNPVKHFNTRDSIFRIDGLVPGNYTVKIYTGDTLNLMYPGNHDSTLVSTDTITISNDLTCSYVQGKVFADFNSNCLYAYPDQVLQGTIVELNPGGYAASTDVNGDFYIPIPNGVYTLKQYSPNFYTQLCPDTNTFTINNSTPGSVFTIAVADSVNTIPDIQLGITANQPRPGFTIGYNISCRNLTPNLVPAQSLTFNYDPNLIFISSSPNYTSSATGQYSYTVPQLHPFESVTISVFFTVPVSTTLGSQLSANATVTSASGEVNIQNNTDTIIQTVTGSYDPNVKSVFPSGFGNDGYITNQQALKYTIQFQNTGTDTAFNIMVVDSLPATLDKYSISILNSSHPYRYELKNPNVVVFYFDNILLTDSTTNEPGSHGQIKFSIRQLPGNPVPTIIENTAAIYFDFNAPIFTNTTKNTLFDCNQMSSVSITDTTACEGDIILADAILLFPMTINWYIDSVFYSSDSSVTLSPLNPGTYLVTMEASNNTCNQTINSTLSVFPIPLQPTFTVNGSLLTSSTTSGNQWYLNNTLIQGASLQTYTATQSGYYSVSTTDLNGCSSISDSMYVGITGIEDITQFKNVRLLPNPALNYVDITNFEFHTADEISLTDISGKIYSKHTINSNSNQIRLELSDLSPGLYFIIINSTNGRAAIKLMKE